MDRLRSEERLLGDLQDAHYAWSRVQDAYAASPGYEEMRVGLAL
jgi:hypothetical protein